MNIRKNLFRGSMILTIAFSLSACSDAGRKVETSEAQEVESKKTEETVSFSTVGEGSHLDWRAAHLGGVEPRFGKIFAKKAEIQVTNGAVSNAAVTIDMGSLTVESFENDEKSTQDLTGHLMTPDFFNVEEYPTAEFVVTGVSAGTGEYNSAVKGNLSILGVTKGISFNANIDMTDNKVSIKSEDFSIDRRDWGIVYNVEGTEGVPAHYIIDNEIGFTIDLTMTK